MATLTLINLTTAEELLALGPDFHGELVRGRVIEMAPASWGHGEVTVTITSILHAFVKKHRLGKVFAAETGFTLERDPDTVRGPDVAYVAHANIPPSADRSKFFEGAPDLAVEVLSPSNSSREMAEKVGDYLRAGTRIVWIVNPVRRTVTAHDASKQDADVLTDADTLTAGDVLPGFSVTVSAFFE